MTPASVIFHLIINPTTKQAAAVSDKCWWLLYTVELLKAAIVSAAGARK
jgi:hypothetical protein